MNLIPSLLNYLELHPFMAITIVFAIAMAEALIVIGLFVPSTAVLVGAGTLVGLGKLSFWPLFLAGALGAIIGDAVSYWAGRHYGRHLKDLWPLKHYPDLMLRGEQFFAAHGMKSIFVGRFIPAVKAIVPGIAGMLHMDHLRFSVINFISAFAWSAAHLIPGLLIGQGLAAANQISARLAVLLLIVLVLVALVAYVARLVILWGVPLFSRLQAITANWAASHEGAFLQRIGRVLHPDHPHALTLLFWSATLIAAITWFAGLTEDVVEGGAILALDHSVANLLQSVRNAPGDALMIAITMLGDGVVLTVLAIGMVGWLLWRRAWYVASTVSLVLLAAAGFVPLAKMLLHRARPMPFYSGADAYSFPSGHATLAATLFGILALLISVNMPRWGRAAVCSVAAAVVAMIAFSRVYLHAHWPSDVVAGLAFGLAMIAVVALALVRMDGAQIAPRRLAVFALVLLLAGYAVHLVRDYDIQQSTFAVTRVQAPHKLAGEDWLRTGWQQMPAYRTEFSGDQDDPFILQWSGPVEHLQTRLEQ
ncbi:MAG: bifunctional DedA family/phosphatase PAP2 family protein [Gammaproteobacteria bacterium]